MGEKGLQIEFALKDLLREFGVERGAVQALALHLDKSRQTASKIINGKKALSTEEIGKICGWLIARVDAKQQSSADDMRKLRKVLPNGLFRATGAIERIQRSNTLWLYLGEQVRLPDPAGANTIKSQWISGHDAEFATELVHRISRDGDKFEFHWENVPFHIKLDSEALPDEEANASILSQDRNAAIDLSKHLMNTTINSGAKAENESVVILIGSQRVNYLVEAIISHLFKVTPFEESTECKVPVYMQYRPGDAARPSCFGGANPPRGWSHKGRPGLYYRNSRDTWAHIDCSVDDKAGGVVLLISNLAQLIVILFGFPGPATHAVGKLFQEKPDAFWPIDEPIGKRRAALFVCKMPPGDSSEPEVIRVPL